MRLTVPRLQNAVQVTSALDVESYPTWSPDGVRLAYQASETGYYDVGNHDIWVAQLGIGEPINLTKGGPANDRMPSWSPDGREIAFLSDREGLGPFTPCPPLAGTRETFFPCPGSRIDNWSAPRWSRDGTTLLVSVRQAGENVVIVLSLKSLESTRVTLPEHEGNVCWDLSVRPDGRRFAYVEGTGGATEVTRLWTIPASGGEAVPLTDGRTNVWSPTWSSGSTQGLLRLESRREHGSLATGSGRRRKPRRRAVRRHPGARDSVGGVFSRWRHAWRTRGGEVAQRMAGAHPARSAATWADAQQVTSEHANIEFVDVSPDGALLAVSSDRRGNQDLWLLPAAGGEMTPLTTDPTPDWNPRWSPNGARLRSTPTAVATATSGSCQRGAVPRDSSPHTRGRMSGQPGRPMATR